MDAPNSIDAATPTDKLTPSVGYVVSQLEARILAGKYPHGRWLPTERALCNEFSVSRPTVRLAIDELVRRSLVRRTARHRPVVWNTAAIGTGATGLREGRDSAAAAAAVRPAAGTRRSIGLWISGDPSDPGPTAMARAILRALPGDDYRVIMACPQGATHEEIVASETRALTRMAEDADCAGVILWHLGGTANVAALEELRRAGKPLVFVDRLPPAGFESDCVGVHNRISAAAAVRHLLGRGHRSIACIVAPDRASTVDERLAGYRQALEEAGVRFRDDLLLVSDFGETRGDAVARHWAALATAFRDLPDRPTAVFAVNDYSAHRFLGAVRDAGLRVPEDVAVVGFDDSDRWSRAPAFLTSVSQPFEEMGAEAARLMRERLEDHRTVSGDAPAPRTYRHVLLPCELVVRGSSG